jgi:hypothetical protein
MGNHNITSTIVSIYLCFFMITGCFAIEGKLIRTYQSEYSATVQASEDTLKYLEIPIRSKVSDKLKTTLIARRNDGTLVTVEIIRVDPNRTEVSVKTSAGIWDERVTKQIHEFIKERLDQSARGIQSTRDIQVAKDFQPLKDEPTEKNLDPSFAPLNLRKISAETDVQA